MNLTLEQFLEEIKKYSRISRGRRDLPSLSRLTWNLYNPNDIVKTGDGFFIHHKDNNKLNDSIENLEKINGIEHIKMHNSGANNGRYGKPAWNKNIPCTEETKRKISLKNTKAFGCKIEGCNRKHGGKGYCLKHYSQFYYEINKELISKKRKIKRELNRIIDSNRGKKKEGIHAFFKINKKGTVKEISINLNKSRENTQGTLSNMIKKGEIIRFKEGRKFVYEVHK